MARFDAQSWLIFGALLPLVAAVAARADDAGPQRGLLLRLIWDLKVRLQFTGWLQFVPPAALGALALLLAGVARWAGSVAIFWTFAAISAGFSARFAYEVAIFRWGLRWAEPLPARRDALDAFDLMRARRACRSFQARDLRDEDREALLAVAARCTRPEALLGARPIRLAYVAAPLTVWPVLGAREFLVAIAPAAYDRLAVIDVGRSLQQVVLEATRMGLGTCWIGPGADQRSVAAQLGDRFDPEADHIVCVCAIGYASRILPLAIRGMALLQRRRKPLRALFFQDAGLEVPLDTEAPPFDRYGRCYEVCQWSPSSYNAQPTRMIGVVSGEGAGAKVARFDFLAATPSRYYAPVALGIWAAHWEAGCAALGIPGALRVPTSPASPGVDLCWVPAV